MALQHTTTACAGRGSQLRVQAQTEEIRGSAIGVVTRIADVLIVERKPPVARRLQTVVRLGLRTDFERLLRFKAVESGHGRELLGKSV